MTLVLVGCVARRWDIGKVKPASPVGDVGVVEFTLIKQQYDYVHVIFYLKNTTKDRTLRFKPIDATDTAWGISLQTPQGVRAQRVKPVTEQNTVIPPGAEGSFEVRWIISPVASDNRWPWSLRLDGLIAGKDEVGPVTVAMPEYK